MYRLCTWLIFLVRMHIPVHTMRMRGPVKEFPWLKQHPRRIPLGCRSSIKHLMPG